MVEYKPSLLDRTFTALSHEVRRAMLVQLRKQELRVSELAAPYDISLNMASKHIRLLEEARLVKRRVEGREHWISADPQALNEALSWMETQAAFWSPRLAALAKIVEKKR